MSKANVSGGSSLSVGYQLIGNDGLFVADACNDINFNNATSVALSGYSKVNPDKLVDSSGRTLS